MMQFLLLRWLNLKTLSFHISKTKCPQTYRQYRFPAQLKWLAKPMITLPYQAKINTRKQIERDSYKSCILVCIDD